MVHEPKIQVIILNHNDFSLTRDCLDSLLASSHRDLDILVLNHAAPEGPLARLRANFPGVTLAESGKNLGYAGGCNRGIELTRPNNPDYFFFLNNDALVEPETLALLAWNAAENPAAGIFGPLVLSGHPQPSIESSGINYNLGTGRFHHLDFGRQLERSGDPRLRLSAAPADALSGCALLVRREVIERLGGFAEEYFFYFEDADFCFRARKAGFDSLLVPPARIRHRGSSTINRLDPGLRVYYSTRNQLLFFNRLAPLPSPFSRSRRDFQIILLNLAFALLRSGVPRGRALEMWRRGVQDFRRGQFGQFTEKAL